MGWQRVRKMVLSWWGITWKECTPGAEITMETIQMRAIMRRARDFVPLRRIGSQMAKKRSTEMAVKVRTDTDTETYCNEKKRREEVGRRKLKAENIAVCLFEVYDKKHTM